MLILGPNDAFLRYISEVLPALGEFDVEQRPLGEVVKKLPIRRTDPPETAALKHDARMAIVIERHLFGRLPSLHDPLVVTADIRRVRIRPQDLERIRRRVVDSGVPYESGRKTFRQQVLGEVVRLGAVASSIL